MIRTLTSLTLLTVALTACAPKGSPMTEYQNPAEVQASRTEKATTFTLTAAETEVTLEGKQVKAQLFNGRFPGPQLTLQAGEQGQGHQGFLAGGLQEDEDQEQHHAEDQCTEGQAT